MPNRMTEEEIRRIEARWKSDVDLKLDALLSAEKEWQEKYSTFIDMMIRREEKRQKLWDAIIEKSLTALVVGGVAALCTMAWNGAMNEFKHIIGGGK